MEIPISLSVVVAGAMPAALGAGILGALGPTPEEVAQAKEVIKSASPSQMRAKMSSMVQWLKLFPDAAVSTSRGQERQAYLEAFVVHQLRAKNQRKTSEHLIEKTQSNQNKSGKRFWNRERLEQNLGKTKANAIINRPGARYRPCRYTGSDDQDLREYEVVSDEEAEITADNSSWKLAASGDATEADFKLMASMSQASSSHDQ